MLPVCGFIGLEIPAFPGNQFGGQESGTNREIAQFACTRFTAEYPIFDKVDLCSYFPQPMLCIYLFHCETDNDLLEYITCLIVTSYKCVCFQYDGQ